MSGADRADNEVFCLLAWAGIGPAHLLTARGRKTGRARTNPVILVKQGKQRWLVAPYGAVSWVLNARAAGQVTLRRGRDRQDCSVRGALSSTVRTQSAALHPYCPGHAALLPGEQGLTRSRLHHRSGPPSGIRGHPDRRGPALRQCRGQSPPAERSGTGRLVAAGPPGADAGTFIPVSTPVGRDKLEMKGQPWDMAPRAGARQWGG